MSQLADSLQEKFTGLQRAIRALRAAKGLTLWLAAWAIIVAVLVVVMGPVNLSATIHAYAIDALVIAAVTSFVAVVIVPAVWPIGRHYVARLVEEEFPDLQDQLLAVVRPATQGFTRERSPLYSELSNRVRSRLTEKNLHRSLDFGRLRNYAAAAGICVVTAGILSLASPEGLKKLLAGPQAPPPVIRKGGGEAEAEKPEATPAEASWVTISDLRVKLGPPDYSGLREREVVDELESIRVLAGTSVGISAQVDGATEAALQWQEGEPTILQSDGGTVEYVFTAGRDREWQLAAGSGDKRVVIGPYSIDVFADRHPEITLTRPGRDLKLKQLRPIELGIEASDDFGIGRAWLLYRKRGRDSWQRQELSGGNGRSVSLAYEWDLRPMKLKPGTAVEYRAVVEDNDEFGGPKKAATGTFTVSLQEDAEADRSRPEAIEAAQKKQEDAVRKLQKQAKQFDKELSELLKKAMSATGDAAASDISKGVLQQAKGELQKRADEVRGAMKEAERALKESPLVSQKMVEKVRELHKLMSELMNDDLRRVMEKMEQALKNLDTKKFTMSLKQARQAQKQFMDKLDRTIDLMRKAKLEAQLQALQRFVKRLADRQDELAKKTEKLPDGTRRGVKIQEQKQLADETRPVAERIRKLREEVARQDEDIAAKLGNLADDFEKKNPAGEMETAAGQMAQKAPSSAVAHQRRASKYLRQTAARLAGASADLTAQQREKLTNAARTLARDALSISRQQEETLGRTRSITTNNNQRQANVLTQKRQLSAVQRRQQIVREGTAKLAHKIRQLAGQTASVPPEIAGRTRQLAQLMATAKRQLAAGEVAGAFNAQKQSMAQLNRLTEDLMKLADKLNKQSAQMAFQQYLKRLEQLAQQQRGLNRRTGQRQQSGKCKKGSGGQPRAGPAGAQLAIQQAMIRKALQKILKGSRGKKAGRGKKGKLSDQLGGVPEKMKQVEDDLKGGQVTPQTIESQREILHRMLDAQRSLYSKRKKSKRRKAERPEEYEEPESPPVLRPAQRKAPKIQRQRRSVSEQQLPLDFERVTKEYLQRVQ